jgi:serine carboxypeptidase-like clade 2
LVPGHYVPQLARKIVEYNKASLYPFINLKGILVSIMDET